MKVSTAAAAGVGILFTAKCVLLLNGSSMTDYLGTDALEERAAAANLLT